MKRFFGVLVVACALLAALTAAPAFAGGPILGGGGSQDQSVTNSTGQENTAGAVNVPVLSGNNVSILSDGSQSNSAGVSQQQENENTTSQQASQSEGSDPSQQQSVSNRTSQENEAGAINVPIASGNNVSVLSEGSQSNSAGVSQQQENENTTKQWASQSGSTTSSCCESKHSCRNSCETKCPPKPCDGQDQSVSNRTKQENEAFAFNVPIVSGNNVALLSTVCQTNSAGVAQNQENDNTTWQRVRQAA